MMGGREWGTPAGRATLQEIRLDRGGYDRHGSYWGSGSRLYRIDSEENADLAAYGRIEPDACRYFRASDRACAIAHVNAKYPKVVLARPF